jgi:SAM-dependent methyltransferase
VLDLICPDCRTPLERSDDSLACSTCSTRFPILNDIPRFVEQEHLESFGLQWNKYEVAHDEEDRATFVAKTGFPLDELSGLRVLDAGCGGGRYAKIVAEAGAHVVAADHTTAVEKAQALCEGLPNVEFLQADLKRLPLREQSFDRVFSIGVMHHDVETRAVFDAVAKLVKPGGKLAVWLYRRNQWWQEAINSGLRRRTVKMSPERLERWARLGAWLGGIPLVKQTLNKIVNFSAHPNRENRVCDTFDWYAPQYQHHHTLEELCRWFEEADFGDLVVLPPERKGRVYRWVYERNLLIGSGVNVQGTRRD